MAVLSGCVTIPPEKLQINTAAVHFVPAGKLAEPKELSWQLQRTLTSPHSMRMATYVPGGGSMSFDVAVPDAGLFGFTDQKTSLDLLKGALATSGFAEHAQAACQATLSFDKADFKSTWGYQHLVDASISVRAGEHVLWSKRYQLDSAQAQSHWKTMTDSYQEGKQKVAQQLLEAATADLVAWGNASQGECAVGQDRRPARLPEGPTPIAGLVRIGQISEIPQTRPGCESGDPFKGGNPFSCRNPAYDEFVKNPLSVDRARRELQGKTRRSFTQAHGTQVSYLATDGHAYLWYPGNAGVVQGQWSVAGMARIISLAHPELQQLQKLGGDRAESLLEGAEDVAYVCFRYDNNTHNPVTGTTGAGWECIHASEYVRGATRETVEGDPFGLAERSEVPWVIPRHEATEYSFEALRQQMALERNQPE